MAFKKAVEEVEPQPQPRNALCGSIPVDTFAQKNHFQQSAENVGQGVKNTLITKIAEPMADKMADAVFAEALRLMGEKLASGETGQLTQLMLNSLHTGVTRPFENWTAQLETWYEPVALLPSSPDSTPS